MAEEKFALYRYHPSGAAAGIFVVLFALCTAYHVYKLARGKTWHFIPFLIGCIFEAVGFASRSVSAKQTPDWTLMPYVIQSLLLLLGPTLFAASIYMTFGRLIRFLGADSHSLIRPSWLTKLFVLGDVLSFFAQSGGGGMLAQAKSRDDTKLGENIITVGLVIQLISFAFFIIVTVLFHRRISNAPTSESLKTTVPWMRFIFVLYTASALIMLRSIFRVAEYVGGMDGPLQSKEMYIYIFDATPMIIVAALFMVYHPSQVLSKKIQAFQLPNDSFIESYPMHSRV